MTKTVYVVQFKAPHYCWADVSVHRKKPTAQRAAVVERNIVTQSRVRIIKRTEEVIDEK